jgi:transcriptional adapter 3
MTYDEKKEILNVSQWPISDLQDLTAGDPPDMDFSNAKPANQVNFSTFQTYIEPFIRPFTEEDVAFLKERGDRVNPYIIPARGAKGYKEVWAAEDGTTGIEPPQKHVNNPNEARGSLEDLDDDIADQDTVSAGPVLSRLLSIIRPASNVTKKEEPAEDANGDTSMVNGDTEGLESLLNGTPTEDFKPVTCLPSDASRPTNLPQLDYETFENRALQELRYLGILSPSQTPTYDSHEDDEVAARLRTLQHELRRISRINNIRKARVLELAEERMAMQEYSNIADDLDNQVNAAYLKRNRSLAKPNPKKGGSAARPGQKGVASGVAGRGVSDGVRALMQKRRDWIEMVGPVVGYGRPPIPGPDETIFGEADVKRLEKLEREAETADVEGE